MTKNRLPRIDNYEVVNSIVADFVAEYMKSSEALEDFAEVRMEYPRMTDEIVWINVSDSAAREMCKILWPIMDQERIKESKRFDFLVILLILIIISVVGNIFLG